jgi:hypothetical protein
MNESSLLVDPPRGYWVIHAFINVSLSGPEIAIKIVSLGTKAL